MLKEKGELNKRASELRIKMVVKGKGRGEGGGGRKEGKEILGQR